MRTSQRRLALMAGAVMAVMALGAGSASAAAPPHNDYENDNWIKVEAGATAVGVKCPANYYTTCLTKSGTNAAWSWKAPWPVSTNSSCTNTGVNLRIIGEGATMIDDVDDWDQYPSYFCQAYQSGSYLDGSEPVDVIGGICKHKPTGQFWVMQGLTLNYRPTNTLVEKTHSFAQLSGAESWGPGSIELTTMQFGNPSTGTHTEWGPFGGVKLLHHAKFAFNGEITLVPTGAGSYFETPEKPCGWGLLK